MSGGRESRVVGTSVLALAKITRQSQESNIPLLTCLKVFVERTFVSENFNVIFFFVKKCYDYFFCDRALCFVTDL